MKRRLFLLGIITMLLFVGCSSTGKDTSGNSAQDSHLHSVEVTVTGVVDQDGMVFAAEALNDCGTKIKQGDTLWITAETAKDAEKLANWEPNHFRVHFSIPREENGVIQITCIELVRLNKNGEPV